MQIARAWRVPFDGPCAAHGKVVFLDVHTGRVVTFQVDGEHGEAVFCGNANVAAAAFAAWTRGESSLALSATDGSTTISLESTVQVAGDYWEVESAWRIIPHPEDFSTEAGFAEVPLARVDTLNHYQFSVGPKLVAPARFDSCRRKGCRITPAEMPEVQVSTCERFHGALPQTGAISLQLARDLFPFIRSAVPSDMVRHPAGVEKLPACHWENHDFVAVMPRTSVEFAKPLTTY